MPGRRPYRQIIDGVPRCAWLTPELFQKGLSFRAADGDVIQSTFPKSATHWIQYITQLIINRGERIDNYHDFASNYRAIEYMDFADWKPVLPVRLLMTHLPLYRETMNENSKYIYVARNPWDVCVSLFHMVTDLSVYQFQDGTFEEFFEAFVEGDVGYGSYFKHVAAGYALKNEPNVFFVTYEELKKYTRGTVLRLAHFLGESYGRALEEDEQMLKNILEWSKPEQMRSVIVADMKSPNVPGWDEFHARNKATSRHGHDGDNDKYAVVREAKVGNWKSYFTPELLARFEKKIQEEGDNATFMQLWSGIRQEAMAMFQASK